MKTTFSYVLVTPYTIAKSRTGAVIARLLALPDLELAGAQMIAPDAEFTRAYAESIRAEGAPEEENLIPGYIAKNLGPEDGKKRRSLLLLFQGEDPAAKLAAACGHIHPEHQGDSAFIGETVRDTYGDFIVSAEDPRKAAYFEPAVITPRNQEAADKDLALFASFLKTQDNITPAQAPGEERTLVIIKPENWRWASSKPGTIISMFARAGLRIAGVKVHRFSLAQALEFYGAVEGALKAKLAPVFGAKAKAILEKELGVALSEDAEKALADSVGAECAWDQFAQIVEFMSGYRPGSRPPEDAAKPGSAKCMILVYEGKDAVKKIRDVLGPTDPLKAPGGTVRRDFGSNVMVNTAHASDSPENARREMSIVKANENDLYGLLEAYLG